MLGKNCVIFRRGEKYANKTTFFLFLNEQFSTALLRRQFLETGQFFLGLISPVGKIAKKTV